MFSTMSKENNKPSLDRLLSVAREKGVIGPAALARRLGETELVANAIGAHHLDEPFNSPYALIVAASDAMSGGRPGARRRHHAPVPAAGRLRGRLPAGELSARPHLPG